MDFNIFTWLSDTSTAGIGLTDRKRLPTAEIYPKNSRSISDPFLLHSLKYSSVITTSVPMPKTAYVLYNYTRNLRVKNENKDWKSRGTKRKNNYRKNVTKMEEITSNEEQGSVNLREILDDEIKENHEKVEKEMMQVLKTRERCNRQEV